MWKYGESHPSVEKRIDFEAFGGIEFGKTALNDFKTFGSLESKMNTLFQSQLNDMQVHSTF